MKAWFLRIQPIPIRFVKGTSYVNLTTASCEKLLAQLMRAYRISRKPILTYLRARGPCYVQRFRDSFHLDWHVVSNVFTRIGAPSSSGTVARLVCRSGHDIHQGRYKAQGGVGTQEAKHRPGNEPMERHNDPASAFSASREYLADDRHITPRFGWRR